MSKKPSRSRLTTAIYVLLVLVFLIALFASEKFKAFVLAPLGIILLIMGVFSLINHCIKPKG